MVPDLEGCPAAIALVPLLEIRVQTQVVLAQVALVVEALDTAIFSAPIWLLASFVVSNSVLVELSAAWISMFAAGMIASVGCRSVKVVRLEMSVDRTLLHSNAQSSQVARLYISHEVRRVGLPRASGLQAPASRSCRVSRIPTTAYHLLRLHAADIATAYSHAGTQLQPACGHLAAIRETFGTFRAFLNPTCSFPKLQVGFAEAQHLGSDVTYNVQSYHSGANSCRPPS